MTAVSPEFDSVKEMIDNRKRKMVESSIILLSSADDAPAVDVTGRGQCEHQPNTNSSVSKNMNVSQVTTFRANFSGRVQKHGDKYMPAVLLVYKQRMPLRASSFP